MENKIALYKNLGVNSNKYYNTFATNIYKDIKQKSTNKPIIKKNNIHIKDYQSADEEFERSNSPYSFRSINLYDFNNKTSTILFKNKCVILNKDNLFDEIEKIKSLTNLKIFFKTHKQAIEKIINDIIKVGDKVFAVNIYFKQTPKINIFLNIHIPYYQDKQFKEILKKNLLNLKEYCKTRKYIFIQTPPYFNKPIINPWERTSWDKKTIL